MTKNLKPDDREKLDSVLLSRPGEADPDTGLNPPSWWKGEEDAAATAASFGKMMGRR